MCLPRSSFQISAHILTSLLNLYKYHRLRYGVRIRKVILTHPKAIFVCIYNTETLYVYPLIAKVQPFIDIHSISPPDRLVADSFNLAGFQMEVRHELAGHFLKFP